MEIEIRVAPINDGSWTSFDVFPQTSEYNRFVIPYY